ncbi:unnamed protein product [Thlaspi arvense]|uniref:non-specific serine/threonine protein kinase n=1 Tax=Thlaspi arvense TaxID=13288 RepID=A0AAU9RFC3_THLAR|nr:unnamed protein product [Thlaspi arvense]
MDEVQKQAGLIEKKISPFVASHPTNVGGLTDQKITGGSETTQPPTTSPPSPPSPVSGGSQSPPPPVTVSPPPPNQPSIATPPPTTPSSPPPSITPPPSPPQPQPPPQSAPAGESPVVIPSPKPQLPLPPPTLVTQQPETRPIENGRQQPNNPISPPPPPFTPFAPPFLEDSGSQESPPFSSPSPPVVPLSPNSPRNPSQPLDSPPVGGSNLVPSSSTSSPSPPSLSGSDNQSGGSNRNNANNNVNDGSGQHNNESNYTEKTMIGIGIAGILVVIFIAVVFFFRRKRKNSSSPRSNQQYLPPANVSVNTDGFIHYRQKPGNGNSSAQNSSPDTNNSLGNPKPTHDSAVIGTAKTLFSYEELSQITEGFCKRFVIGEGGFGCVFKGILCDGKPIAIKQLKSISAEGYREFKAEVEIISRVHHKHLVSLVGYCISEQHRFLIYEFVPNNTLDYHLHGKDLPVLEWTRRVKIAIGAAKGLAYLHEDCHPKIIHRDIKSSNILLDDEYEAQAKSIFKFVADFGLARLNDTAQSHISTRVMGTFGYLAPEYASSGKLTDRSDVFSFGVVLLELITGRKPVDTSQPLGEESLVEWARPRLIEAIEKGDISEVVDPRLEKHYVEGEVYRMIETAASCVRHSALKRPRMVQVVRALDTIDDLTNGVKVGQSTVYNSGQYSNEIRIFRRASEDSSDFGTNNAYYTNTSQDYTSRESESRAFNTSHRTTNH